jgi:hypothetical protein
MSEARGAKVGGGVLFKEIKEVARSPSPTRRDPQFPGTTSWLPRPQRKLNGKSKNINYQFVTRL